MQKFAHRLALAGFAAASFSAMALAQTPAAAPLQVPQTQYPPLHVPPLNTDPSAVLPNIALPVQPPFSVPAPDARLANANPPTDPQVLKGAYLARMGDCAACHTAPGGQAFAGGLPIASPIGTIYSTNITPDKQDGIGDWSFDDFAKLMRTGVTKAGYTVYPAMPYPSYSRLTDDDLHALYAYFTQGVQPVAQENHANGIPWPLSMRWPLGIWRAVFAPSPQPFTPASGDDAQLARGAYLVEGLGHCGSCHTGRSITLQEKALTGASSQYLAGGQIIDGWVAPSLRNENGSGLGQWSEDEIVAFLRYGRNDRTAAFGAMNDVITDSTQYFSDDDLKAIAVYLKSLKGPGDAAPYAYDSTLAGQLFHGNAPSPVAQLYIDRCAACHRSNGTGNGRAFPALAGNSILQSQDPTSAIHIILTGGRQPYTEGAPSTLAMGPYAYLLSDQQIADLVTFIQQSWGNKGGAATADQVAKLRKAYGDHPVQ